jgi:methionyl-tRNA formyltransferase
MSVSIVVITTDDSAKREFVNRLHQQTGEQVKLVLVYRNPRAKWWQRFKRRLKTVGWLKLWHEFWFALKLRVSRRTQQALNYFHRATVKPELSYHFFPPTKSIVTVNTNEIHKLLRELSPKLIVVWGSPILQPHIIGSAKKVINLHMGYCPHYRGSISNQWAVLDNRWECIGATIHYVEQEVDSGQILSIIPADHSKPPEELFLDLNNRAREQYLEIATRLYNGEDLPGVPQDISLGRKTFIKVWTHERRYRVAKAILDWEQHYSD